MTKLWTAGELIQVEVDDNGWPRSFVWDGETHPVDSVVQFWRVDTEWWVTRLQCEFFQVITTSGKLAIIYRDLLLDLWWFQRLYD